MKKNTIILTGVVILLLAAVSFAGFIGEDNDAELKEIVQTVSDFELAMAEPFDSPDGTTASMTEEEIQENIDAYNALVDSAYSVNHPCRNSYKNDHEYWMKGSVFNEWNDTHNMVTFENGISECKILKVKIGENGSKANVKAGVTVWLRRVFYENGKFRPRAGASRTYWELELVKEDGKWKVEENVDIIPSDCSCYNEEEVKDYMDRMPCGGKNAFSKEKLLNNEEKAAIEEKIAYSKSVCEKLCDTYEEARDLAKSIDVINGNYYALY